MKNHFTNLKMTTVDFSSDPYSNKMYIDENTPLESHQNVSFDYFHQHYEFTSDSDLLDRIKTELSIPRPLIDSGENLIPPGLKYIYNNHVVYERPPTYKLINTYGVMLDQVHQDSKSHSYYLPIPWQLYIVEFDNNLRTSNVRMYFMNTPLLSEDQILYLPPIPNFYVNGSLCRPFFDNMDDIEKYSQDLFGIINSSYDWVWSSNFNLDLTETISSIYSQKNPSEISSSRLNDHNYTHYRLPMSCVHDTYSRWEQFDLNQVTNFVWPNPAFNQTFDADAGNYDTYDLALMYIQDNDLYSTYDTSEFEDESEFVDYVINYDEGFRDSIPNPRSVKKTFSSILMQTFKESHFTKLNKNIFEKKLIDYANANVSMYLDTSLDSEPF